MKILLFIISIFFQEIFNESIGLVQILKDQSKIGKTGVKYTLRFEPKV